MSKTVTYLILSSPPKRERFHIPTKDGTYNIEINKEYTSVTLRIPDLMPETKTQAPYRFSTGHELKITHTDNIEPFKDFNTIVNFLELRVHEGRITTRTNFFIPVSNTHVIAFEFDPETGKVSYERTMLTNIKPKGA